MRTLVDRVYSTSLVPAGATATASSTLGGETDGFRAARVLDADLDSWWAPAGEARTGSLTVALGAPVTFDRVRLQEYVALGQRVSLRSIRDWPLACIATGHHRPSSRHRRHDDVTRA
jgi:alpha-L-fucosidase